MKYIISNLLEISIYSGFAVLFVLVMRLLFKKASKAVICNMWLLIGLRLVIFIPIETGMILFKSSEG